MKRLLSLFLVLVMLLTMLPTAVSSAAPETASEVAGRFDAEGAIETGNGIRLFGDEAATVSETVSISGTVVLPHALDHDERILFHAYSPDYSDHFGSEILLPAGQTSANYSLTLPKGQTVGSLYAFLYHADCDIGNLIALTYYHPDGTDAPDGTSSPSEEAIFFVADADRTVNFTFFEGITLHGSLSVPDGYSLTNDQKFYVYASTGSSSFSGNGSITAGQTSADWYITVPADAVITRLYAVLQGEAPSGLDTTAYYYLQNSSSTAINLRADQLPVFLPIALSTSAQLSGSVVLPYTLPNDMNVRVIASVSGSSARSVRITIPAGQTSASWSLPVAKGSTINYIEADPVGAAEFYPQQYYTPSGTVPTYTRLNLPITSFSDPVQIELQTGVPICGTLRLPEGAQPLTTIGNYDVNVMTRNPDTNRMSNYYSYLSLEAGRTEADWTVVLPETEDNIYSISLYLRDGFPSGYLAQYSYTPAGAFSPYDLNLSVEDLPDSIDFVLEEGELLHGVITLPDSMADYQGKIRCDIAASVMTDDGNSNSYHTDVTIIPGQPASYSLAVPKIANAVLRSMNIYFYDYNTGMSIDALPDVYYTPDGPGLAHQNLRMSVSEAAARSLDFDMNSLSAVKISGTISLPEDAAGYGYPLTIRVVAEEARDDFGPIAMSSVFVTLQDGQTSAPFSIPVTEGRYRLSFGISSKASGNLITDEMYYAPGGLSIDYDDAAIIQAGTSGLSPVLRTGKPISGTISFPEGAELTGTFTATVNLINSDGFAYGTGMQIGNVSSSYYWTICVPDDPDGYLVSVYFHLGPDYETNLSTNEIYCAADGCTYKENLAVPFLAGSTVPYPIMPSMAQRLTCYVSIPEAVFETQNTFSVSVFLDYSDGGRTDIYQQFTAPGVYPLTFNVPTDPSITYALGVSGYAECLREGYYYWAGADNEPSNDLNQAVRFGVGDPAPTFTLPMKETIPLRIEFDESVVLSGDYDLLIRAYSYNSSTGYEGNGSYLDIPISGTDPIEAALRLNEYREGYDQIYFYYCLAPSDSGSHETNLPTNTNRYLAEEGWSSYRNSKAYFDLSEIKASGKTLTLSPGRMVYGTVIWPEGYVSDGTDKSIEVRLVDVDSSTSYSSYYIGKTAVKPDGSFAFACPENDYPDRYAVDLFIGNSDLHGALLSDTSNSAYAVDAQGETFIIDGSVSGDISGLRVPTVAGRILSGEIHFPENLYWTDYYCNFSGTILINCESFSTYVNFPIADYQEPGSGPMTIPYSVTVPDSGEQPVTLYYYVYCSASDSNYLRTEGYYTESGYLASEIDDAAEIILNADRSGLDINTYTGEDFTVTLNRPEGFPEGYFDVDLLMIRNGSTFRTDDYLNLSYTDPSEQYVISLPDTDESYYLAFQVSEYSSSGLQQDIVYVNPDGTETKDFSEAVQWTAAQTRSVTIAPLLTEGHYISGWIDMGEDFDPFASYYIRVYGEDEDGSTYYADVGDKDGNRFPYTLHLPADLTSVYVYAYYEEYPLAKHQASNIEQGSYWFTGSGVMGRPVNSRPETAAAFDPTDGIDDLNVTLPHCFAIRGKLIPDGEYIYSEPMTFMNLSVINSDYSLNYSDRVYETYAEVDEDLNFLAYVPYRFAGELCTINVGVYAAKTNLVYTNYYYNNNVPVTMNGSGMTGIDIPVNTVAAYVGTLALPASMAEVENLRTFSYTAQLFNTGSNYTAGSSANLYLDHDTPEQRFMVAPSFSTDADYLLMFTTSSYTPSEADEPCFCAVPLYYAGNGKLTTERSEAFIFSSSESVDFGRLELPEMLKSVFTFRQEQSGYLSIPELSYELTNGQKFSVYLGTYANGTSDTKMYGLAPAAFKGAQAYISLRLSSDPRTLYLMEDGHLTPDRGRAALFTLDNENRHTIWLASGNGNPVAQIERGLSIVMEGDTICLNGSGSHDDGAIVGYQWYVNNAFIGSGETFLYTVPACVSECDELTVKLVITDYSGVTDSDEITLLVYPADSANVTRFTMVDTQDPTKVIPNAEMKIRLDDGTEQSYRSNADGVFTAMLADGGYTASVIANGYEPRTFSFTRDETHRAFTVYLNSTSLLDIQTNVTEMTLDEIRDAGIDTSDPDNRHVYNCVATLVFGNETYVCEYQYNDAGTVVGMTDSASCEVLPVSKDIYLIVKSTTGWLKEMFDVALLINNTSAVERIEGVTAKLQLPEGLSLAAMVSSIAAQSSEVYLDSIAPGETNETHWYVRGDAEGEYTITGTVTGRRVGGGITEPISASFRTDPPLEVLGGSAMKLTIRAGSTAVAGHPYHLYYTLENVSPLPVYELSFNVLGGTTGTVTTYTELLHEAMTVLEQDVPLEGEYIPTDGTLYVETLEPGDKIAGRFTITFPENLDPNANDQYFLKYFFTLTDEESTAIPTEIITEDDLHEWDEGERLSEPTCTEDGVIRYTCFCGETKDEAIPKLGHSFTTYVYNNDATCTQDGTETAHCDRDGCTATDTRTRADTALGHSFTTYVYNDDATCTQNGTETACCEHEGCTETDTRTKANTMLPHEWDEGTVTKEPTLTETGEMLYHCQHCTATKTEELPKLQQQVLFNVTPIKFQYGATKKFNISVMNRSSGGGKVHYASSNESILAIEESVTSAYATILGAGTVEITATAEAVPLTYAESSTTITITIDPAALTITPQDRTITYGDPLPADFTYTASGFAEGDTAASLQGTPVYTCSYLPGSDAGSYPITLTGLSSPNYEITFESGTLTVEKASSYTLAFDAQTLNWKREDENIAAVPVITPADASAQFKVEYAPHGTENWSETVPDASGEYDVRASLLSSSNLTVNDAVTCTGVMTIRDSAFVTTGDTTYFIDVTENDDGSVEISMDAETLQQFMDDNAAAANSDITVDLTGNGVASGTDGLIIPADLVDAMQENGNVGSFTVKATDAEITMDKAVLQTVSDAMDENSTLQINVEAVSHETLTPAQQSALASLGGGEDIVVLNLQLVITDESGATESLHQLDGVVDVRVAYDQPIADGMILIAFYVDDDGMTSYLPVAYEDGFVTFQTDHFSIYTVTETPVYANLSGNTLTLNGVPDGVTAILAEYDAAGRMLSTTSQISGYSWNLSSKWASFKVFFLGRDSAPLGVCIRSEDLV